MEGTMEEECHGRSLKEVTDLGRRYQKLPYQKRVGEDFTEDQIEEQQRRSAP